MRPSTAIFAAWCALVVAGYSVANYYGWSPFANGGRQILARGPVGPQHK